MKCLKFSEPLPGLILSGKKTATWRINDDKDISSGDLLSLCDTKGIEFAQAKVVSVKETTFGALSAKDREGHEPYHSNKEMYKTFSKYYNVDVSTGTKVKIIKFQLFNK